VNAESLDCGPAGCLASITGVPTVREQVRGFLPDLASEQAAEVVLVVDELLTNAFRHGKPPVRLRVAHQHEERRLSIEVSDASPRPAHPRAPTLHGGRGLRLVTQICADWGTQPTEHGKTVWGQLVLPPEPTSKDIQAVRQQRASELTRQPSPDV
jgi:anti-sigma regulatory factor (Ser/Thr protein kinase)